LHEHIQNNIPIEILDSVLNGARKALEDDSYNDVAISARRVEAPLTERRQSVPLPTYDKPNID
jgi:hypothetical protein